MSHFTCALFLQILCCDKLGLNSESDETLQELRHLIQRNHSQDVIHGPKSVISWQILGICQQIKGNDQSACHSYLMALPDFIDYQKVAACILDLELY